MRQLHIIFCMAVIAMFITACEVQTTGSARQLYNMSVEDVTKFITTGKTTLSDLEARWGKPDKVTNTPDGKLEWTYEDSELYHGHKGTTKKSIVVRGTARPNGVIQSYHVDLKPR
ncbi:MAG: hypothetical protein LBR22_07430 [Desulfovibrio sp.]|jgi:hypothetical protein|nr:hypothetical protein [Desulfovibrio sp.]